MAQPAKKSTEVESMLQRSIDTAQGIIHFVNGRNKKINEEARSFYSDPAKEEAFRKLVSELSEYRSMLETQIQIITQEKQSFMDMQKRADEDIKKKIEELDAARPPPGIRDKREWNGRRESAMMMAADLRIQQLERTHQMQLDKAIADTRAEMTEAFAKERAVLEANHEDHLRFLMDQIIDLQQQMQEREVAFEAAARDFSRRVSDTDQRVNDAESELRARYDADMQAKDRAIAELRRESAASLEATTQQYESRLNSAQQALEDAKREADRAAKLTETTLREEYEPQLKAANERYQQEYLQRKSVYNQLQELKGNIRVYCRVRPMSELEAAAAGEPCITFPGENDLIINRKKYSFNHVFTPSSTQEDVFEEVRPLVTSVLDGYNVCIFAYGQTGSGKTHTMEGREGDRGVNPRALTTLFEKAQERSQTHAYTIQVSMLEIYNEQIRDLLNADNDAKLEIRQGERGPHVPELSVVDVNSMEDVWRYMKLGASNRAISATDCNEHSSRSHSMLCVYVRGEDRASGHRSMAKLSLIDLAGSERVSKSGVTGERLKEAQHINKSLSTLGNVINALSTRNAHVPYRDSKLTHLLSDSLGGDAKTLMMLQISPVEASMSESLCSLNFGQRVASVELGAASKHIDTSVKMKDQLSRAAEELRAKERLLEDCRERLSKAEQAATRHEIMCSALQEELQRKDREIRREQEKVASLLAEQKNNRPVAMRGGGGGGAGQTPASTTIKRAGAEIKVTSQATPKRAATASAAAAAPQLNVSVGSGAQVTVQPLLPEQPASMRSVKPFEYVASPDAESAAVSAAWAPASDRTSLLSVVDPPSVPSDDYSPTSPIPVAETSFATEPERPEEAFMVSMNSTVRSYLLKGDEKERDKENRDALNESRVESKSAARSVRFANGATPKAAAVSARKAPVRLVAASPYPTGAESRMLIASAQKKSTATPKGASTSFAAAAAEPGAATAGSSPLADKKLWGMTLRSGNLMPPVQVTPGSGLGKPARRMPVTPGVTPVAAKRRKLVTE